MTSRASVEGRGTLRLFFGLPLPAAAAERLAAWQEDALGGIRGVRAVPSAHLHVTLAFLGARPAAELECLRLALHEAAVGAQRPVLRPVRYRETARVAMIVCDDEDGRAARFQRRLSDLLERLDVYRPEARPWLAHVTVARFGARPRLRPALPALGNVSPSDAALYHSLLRPDGAQYTILEAAALGG